MVVDTHIGRIAVRLGLTKETDSKKAIAIEKDLIKVIPEKERENFGTSENPRHCPVNSRLQKRGPTPIAGTALRVLCTIGVRPFFASNELRDSA